MNMRHILYTAAFTLAVVAIANRTSIGQKLIGNGSSPWF